MRVIDCPHCRRRLRFPDAESGRSVVCPGCGNRFVIAHEDGAWVSRFPGETDSVGEAIQSATPPVLIDETTTPEELEEEPKELARAIVTDKQSFFVDVVGRRTRITHRVFKTVFALTVVLGVVHFFQDGTSRAITTEVILGYLFAVPMIGLILGFISLLVTSAFFPIDPDENARAEEIIEERRQQRRDRKRKRRKALKRHKSDEGPRDRA